MSNYTKFRVEAQCNDVIFAVQVKTFFGWDSGYIKTNYFAISYDTKKLALEAIERYKNRYTEG